MVKKVQPVTHQPLIATSTNISSEQLLNDLHYQQSKQIIQTLLNKGLISPTEFKDIDSLNKQSFPPLLGPGNVDTSSLQS
jgi:ribulose bisphosphate carboxylase small subunit